MSDPRGILAGMTIALLTLSCGHRTAYVWPSGDPPAAGTTTSCDQCGQASTVEQVE